MVEIVFTSKWLIDLNDLLAANISDSFTFSDHGEDEATASRRARQRIDPLGVQIGPI